MSPERWRSARDLFHEALRRQPQDRPAFLREACGDSPELAEEVLSLLSSYEMASEDFLSPVVEAAPRGKILEGRQIGSYRILHQLGRGGMGTVYLAERADEQYRKRVAIKLLKPGEDDSQLVRRFSNERQMLAVLDHPNIVKLLDAGVADDGTPYFVMDYIEGQPIDEFCQTRGLSIPERLTLFRQVCAAVHYAHRNLVVHRDLKPSNILVTPDGVPKLLDFGIAKLLLPEYGSMAIGLTRSMQPMTPEYASPEQMSGQPITTSSDVYSLGVLLYRLIAGRHPYEMGTKTAAELERIVCHTIPERPTLAARAASGGKWSGANDIDNIVMMAMRKEPQRRYPSAEHLSEDIRRYLANAPVIACPDTVRYRAGKFVGRHRIGVTASALAAVALVATAITVWQLKAVAERRFVELRHSASFMLFDLDTELRKGITPARKLVVTEATALFDRMARDASGDDALKAEAADGYHRIGDIQGNPERSNLGDLEGAKASYEKELSIGKSMKPGIRCNLVVARAHIGLGRLAAFHPATDNALEHFRMAQALFQTAEHSVEGKQGLRAVAEQTGKLWEARGDVQQTSLWYRKSLEYSKELDRLKSTPKSRADITAESFLYAYSLARAGHTEESLGVVNSALEIAKALAEENPSYRRDYAALFGLLGFVHWRVKRNELAIVEYQRSIAIFDDLAAKDPRDQRARLDLAQMLGEMSRPLWSAKRVQEARDATSRALDLLRPVATSKSAPPFVLVAYTTFLLSPSNAHRDNAATLEFALRANRECPSFEVSDLLAHAYLAAGDAKSARQVAERALMLLPPGADPDLLQSLQALHPGPLPQRL